MIYIDKGIVQNTFVDKCQRF